MATTAIPVSFSQDSKDLEAAIDVFDANPFSRQFVVLVKASLEKRRIDLLALALDLCVPPLSLLVVLWIGCTLSSLMAAFLGASWTPVGVLAIAGLVLMSAILAAWAKFGRVDLPLRELLAVPFYILWKVPLYLKFLIRPQKTWVRTERDEVKSN